MEVELGEKEVREMLEKVEGEDTVQDGLIERRIYYFQLKKKHVFSIDRLCVNFYASEILCRNVSSSVF